METELRARAPMEKELPLKERPVQVQIAPLFGAPSTETTRCALIEPGTLIACMASFTFTVVGVPRWMDTVACVAWVTMNMVGLAAQVLVARSDLRLAFLRACALVASVVACEAVLDRDGVSALERVVCACMVQIAPFVYAGSKTSADAVMQRIKHREEEEDAERNATRRAPSWMSTPDYSWADVLGAQPPVALAQPSELPAADALV